MDARATTASEPAQTQFNRSEGSISTYLLSFAVAVILYVLSPGPIAKCASAAYRPALSPSAARVVAIAYAPITLCANHFPAVDHFYNWYITDFWKVGIPPFW